jgi:hypothetical protein
MLKKPGRGPKKIVDFWGGVVELSAAFKIKRVGFSFGSFLFSKRKE